MSADVEAQSGKPQGYRQLASYPAFGIGYIYGLNQHPPRDGEGKIARTNPPAVQELDLLLQHYGAAQQMDNIHGWLRYGSPFAFPVTLTCLI